jgi:hypothetical protein
VSYTGRHIRASRILSYHIRAIVNTGANTDLESNTIFAGHDPNKHDIIQDPPTLSTNDIIWKGNFDCTAVSTTWTKAFWRWWNAVLDLQRQATSYLRFNWSG